MAKLFIAAKRRLEELEFIRCIDLGNDSQGIFYILIYAYKYPTARAEKAK